MPKQASIFGPGISYETRSGYLRYSAPKERRGKYVHRALIEQLIAQTPYSVRLLVLQCFPYEVHHIDYNKLNNEPSNLLMLSKEFHSCLTGRHTAVRRFTPKWAGPCPALQEVLKFEDERIPF